MDRSIRRQRANKVSVGGTLNFPPNLPLPGIATKFPSQSQGGAGFVQYQTSPDQLRQPLLSDDESVTTFISRIINDDIKELSIEEFKYGQSITIKQFETVFYEFFNKDGGGAYILPFIRLAEKLNIQWTPTNENFITGLVELNNINTGNKTKYIDLKTYVEQNIKLTARDFDKAVKGQGDRSQYETVAKDLQVRWPSFIKRAAQCFGKLCRWPGRR